MAEMKLIPFKVESIESSVKEIPYGVNQLKAPKMWRQKEQGEGCVVCILDTGIDINHPDLKEQIIAGKNFVEDAAEDDYSDKNGHGTHVAGIIAAVEDDKGVVGVAPKAKLLIGRVLDANGSGSYQGIINGLMWAASWKGPNNERVRVINMSLGGPEDDPNLRTAILECVSKGIVVVVASGNEGDNREETMELGYPALYNECITVAACDEEKKLAYFSNNSLQVDVIAAGVNVLSTYPTSGYARLSGTSMATPHIAGTLALIINWGEKFFKRELTESEIYALLAKSAKTLGYETSSEGHGLPDLSYTFRRWKC
jgi:major intracellular serine protease